MEHVSVHICINVTFYKIIATLLITSDYLIAYTLMIAIKIISYYLQVLQDLRFASLPVRNKSDFYFSHLINIMSIMRKYCKNKRIPHFF